MSEQIQRLAKRFMDGALPSRDPKNPKRHGWKCKCNCGFKQKMGGVRNGIHYFKALKELKKLKEEHKKHDLQIEHSYHAAELAHAYVEQTTDQTHSSSAWQTELSMGSGNFTAGNKYLLVVMAHVSGFQQANIYNYRTQHGSTGFTESEAHWEFALGTSESRYLYSCFPVTIQELGLLKFQLL